MLAWLFFDDITLTDGWRDFLIAVTGALVGAGVTILGVRWALSHERNIAREQRDHEIRLREAEQRDQALRSLLMATRNAIVGVEQGAQTGRTWEAIGQMAPSRVPLALNDRRRWAEELRVQALFYESAATDARRYLPAPITENKERIVDHLKHLATTVRIGSDRGNNYEDRRELHAEDDQRLMLMRVQTTPLVAVLNDTEAALVALIEDSEVPPIDYDRLAQYEESFAHAYDAPIRCPWTKTGGGAAGMVE